MYHMCLFLKHALVHNCKNRVFSFNTQCMLNHLINVHHLLSYKEPEVVPEVSVPLLKEEDEPSIPLETPTAPEETPDPTPDPVDDTPEISTEEPLVIVDEVPPEIPSSPEETPVLIDVSCVVAGSGTSQ